MADHEEFTVSTEGRVDVRDVTAEVARLVPGTADGTCTAFVRHTTAGLCVNEAESRLLADVETLLADLVPEGGWQHDELDGNADAHLRSILLGSGVTVPVRDGELQLGTWQSILLVEGDGPRTRTVAVVTG